MFLEKQTTRWVRGTPAELGNACAVERKTEDPENWRPSNVFSDAAIEYVAKTIQALGYKHPSRINNYIPPRYWNDAMAKNKEEVLKVLRHAHQLALEDNQ